MFKNKRFRRIITVSCIALSVILVFICVTFSRNTQKSPASFPVSVTEPILSTDTLPEFSGTDAVGACLIDAKSGAVLYAKNKDKRLPMASTTKIMTALTVLETVEPNTVIKVPKAAVGIEGSSIYLMENEEISVENLLYGLLLESGNDAAEALALYCAGSDEKFSELMNQKAHDFGLIDTHFTNPHGLNDPEHYTTAYELCVIAANALENNTFKKIVSSQKYHAAINGSDNVRFFSNHNRLLRYYNGCIGVKTGFTKVAGRCLVSAAQRDDRVYVAVTLNDGNDWKDHQKMLDFAFENFDSIEIAAPNSIKVFNYGRVYSNPDGIYLTLSKSTTHPDISYSVEFKDGFAQAKYYLDGTISGTFGLSEVTSE